MYLNVCAYACLRQGSIIPWADLKSVILLTQLSQCWDDSCVPPRTALLSCVFRQDIVAQAGLEYQPVDIRLWIFMAHPLE